MTDDSVNAKTETRENKPAGVELEEMKDPEKPLADSITALVDMAVKAGQEQQDSKTGLVDTHKLLLVTIMAVAMEVMVDTEADMQVMPDMEPVTVDMVDTEITRAMEMATKLHKPQIRATKILEEKHVPLDAVVKTTSNHTEHFTFELELFRVWVCRHSTCYEDDLEAFSFSFTFFDQLMRVTVGLLSIPKYCSLSSTNSPLAESLFITCFDSFSLTSTQHQLAHITHQQPSF